MGLGKALLRRKAKRYKRQAINTWTAICEKYEMAEFMQGGNYPSWCDYPADKYGWAKAGASGGILGFIAGVLENPLSLGALALGVVGGVLVGGVWGGVIIAGNSISYIMQNIYAKQIYNAKLSLYFEEARAASLANIQGARSERAAASEALEKSIIWGGYEIYANGGVYKDNAPGKNSNFLSQCAFDTSKGIYAKFEKSAIDEKIQNREGINLAGGESYPALSVNIDLPLAKSLNENDNFKIIKEGFLARALKSQECFNELIANGYGLGCEGDFLKRAWGAIDTLTLKGYKLNLKVWDFLEKNKAYNKALLRDFFNLETTDFNNEIDVNATYKETSGKKNDKAIKLIYKKESLIECLSQMKHFRALNIKQGAEFVINNAYYKRGKTLANNALELLEGFKSYKELSEFVESFLALRVVDLRGQMVNYGFYTFNGISYIVEFEKGFRLSFENELKEFEKEAKGVKVENYYKQA